VNNSPTSWFKAMRDPDALELLKQSPNAFVLLYIIAARARWRAGMNKHGLVQGEAFIGDYSQYGMTERGYRTAKAVLQRRGLATFRPTNKGTVATLCDATVFDINIEATDGHNDRQVTDNRRASDGQPTTNEEGKKVRKEEGCGTPATAGQRPTLEVWLDEAEEIHYTHIFGNELEAVHVWNEFEGVGWVWDARGTPVNNWRGLIRDRKRTTQGRPPNRKFVPAIFRLKRKIAALEKEDSPELRELTDTWNELLRVALK